MRKILGALTYSVENDDFAEIHLLAVNNGHRRFGYGNALMNELKRKVKN